uniref:hypothetical protein n=1 Tax=Arachidicoccus sp. BS20 TaxID=1850526 RepID=UPI001E57DED1|nr:hypothetical protein [Arachidicoccus sp. BS20]
MLNEDKIIRIFCLIDDLLKGIGHQEDVCCRVSDSEVITTAETTDISSQRDDML